MPKSYAIAANGRFGAYGRILRSRHTIRLIFHYSGTVMLTLAGASALSPFRLRRLLGELQSIASDVRAVQARFMHFVEIDAIDGDARDDERAMLQQLLDYGPHREAQQYAGELFLVVPRPGTLSPWSSKATDIARNCGLARVRRIERGIAYYVSCDGTIACSSCARASPRRCTIAWSRRCSRVSTMRRICSCTRRRARCARWTFSAAAARRWSARIASSVSRSPMTRSIICARLSSSSDAIRPTSS